MNKKEERVADIWLHDHESEGVLPCGCKLIREMDDRNPGLLICEGHRKPAHIIIELSEGLIRAVWSTDPNIHVESFHNEDDPPECTEDVEEWETDVAAKRQDIEEKGMVDLYQ
jgi:hypothetical protein